MIYTLRFTARAIEDLSKIRAYISVESPERAESYALELWDHIQSLKSMPIRCPMAPEAQRREIRYLIHGNYRILFVVKGKAVMILRIIHGARHHFKVGRA